MIARMKRVWRAAGLDEGPILVGVALCSLLLWGFFVLAADVSAGAHLPLETRILRSLRTAADPGVGIGPAWLPEAARDMTALGSTAVLTLLVGVVLAWLMFRRRYEIAGFVFAATGSGALLSVALKFLIGRKRPTVVPHLMAENSLSFPSGHSMGSFVVYFTLAAVLARMVERRREKLFFVGLAAMLSFLIGLSRIYLGVHYPSDVLGGWAAGTVWAGLWAMTLWWLERRRAHKKT